MSLWRRSGWSPHQLGVMTSQMGPGDTAVGWVRAVQGYSEGWWQDWDSQASWASHIGATFPAPESPRPLSHKVGQGAITYSSLTGIGKGHPEELGGAGAQVLKQWRWSGGSHHGCGGCCCCCYFFWFALCSLAC